MNKDLNEEDKNIFSTQKLSEECGVLGFYDNNGFDSARMLYYGLFALQHRGQESCGIVANDDGVLTQVKDFGLAGEVFNDSTISTLKGSIAVGHVRYGKLRGSKENIQPIVSRYKKGTITLAYNGKITNAGELREELEGRGAIFQSSSDIEVILHLIAIERTKTHSIEDAALKVMDIIKGAYSMILMSPRKLIAMRDPSGFRPLCIGKIKDSYIFASESCALDAMRADFVREVKAGEVVIVSQNGLTSLEEKIGKNPAICAFEYLYFARPDSIIGGVSAYSVRHKAGELLAQKYPADADIVIGVPDSGLSFAHGFAHYSKIPYADGLIKNRYLGRASITPTESEKALGISLKINVLKANIQNKRVVLVDDSLVQGITAKTIIKMLKDNGAKEVHLRIAAPMFSASCDYGTLLPEKQNMLANKYTAKEIQTQLNADSLATLTPTDLKTLTNAPVCTKCFNKN